MRDADKQDYSKMRGKKPTFVHSRNQDVRDAKRKGDLMD